MIMRWEADKYRDNSQETSEALKEISAPKEIPTLTTTFINGAIQCITDFDSIGNCKLVFYSLTIDNQTHNKFSTVKVGVET